MIGLCICRNVDRALNNDSDSPIFIFAVFCVFIPIPVQTSVLTEAFTPN